MYGTRRSFLAGTTTLLAASGAAAQADPAEAARAAERFGVVGDGIADDTAALQRLIDETAGPLELPPGSFRLTGPLVLDTTRRGYSGVRGAQGASRLIMDGPGPAVRVLGGHEGTANPASVKPETWEGQRFPILAGFEVLGRHPEADGIELCRTIQPVIASVLLRECRHGIHLVERNRNVIIAECHIYRCLDSGIFMDNCDLHQVIVIGCHISYCSRAGIRQLNGDVHNIQITGNDIEYNAGSEELSGEIVLEIIEQGMISEYTIASNTIQAVPSHAGSNVILSCIEGKGAIGQIAITGNVLGSRDKNLAVFNAGRAVTVSANTIYTGKTLNIHLAGCRSVAVTGNTIISSSPVHGFEDVNGLLLEDCAECLISGNVINTLSQGSEERGGAVTLLRCADTAVTSCQILDPRHRGVYLEDCTRCLISGNTVADRSSPARMTAAIEAVGSGRGNVIQGNLVTGGSEGAVRCESGAAVAVGNTVVEEAS